MTFLSRLLQPYWRELGAGFAKPEGAHSHKQQHSRAGEFNYRCAFVHFHSYLKFCFIEFCTNGCFWCLTGWFGSSCNGEIVDPAQVPAELLFVCFFTPKSLRWSSLQNMKSMGRSWIQIQLLPPSIYLNQGCPTLLLLIDCPAQFISNPNETHLKQPIKVFRITWTFKAGVFD